MGGYRMTTLRTAAQQALEALETWTPTVVGLIERKSAAITALRAALAEIEASKGVPVALMTTWVSETEAVTEPLYKAPRRLTDAEIGEVWFAAKIPGLTEANARRLIRAVEARSGAR